MTAVSNGVWHTFYEETGSRYDLFWLFQHVSTCFVQWCGWQALGLFKSQFFFVQMLDSLWSPTSHSDDVNLPHQALEQWLPVIDGLHIGQLVEIEAKMVKILDMPFCAFFYMEPQLQQIKMSWLLWCFDDCLSLVHLWLKLTGCKQ